MGGRLWMNMYQAVATQKIKKNKSAEARALKIQRISTNTDRAFSSSTERFRSAQENAELQVQRGPGYTKFCNQPQQYRQQPQPFANNTEN